MLRLKFHGHSCWEIDDNRHRVLVDPFLTGNPLADVGPGAFDALDAIIKLIRASDGKADAAVKIMRRFSLDAEQTDAILELKIYRLARLEILIVQQELADKRARARRIGAGTRLGSRAIWRR